MNALSRLNSLIEVAVAGAVVLALSAVQHGSALDRETLLAWSAGLIGTGLVIGLPAGLGYHVLLARALAAANLDAKRWWLRPTSFHGVLAPTALRRITPWFRVGAAGFLVVAAGCGVLLVLAIAVSRPQ